MSRVRVIADKIELTRLCQRPAPGADSSVWEGWVECIDEDDEDNDFKNAIDVLAGGEFVVSQSDPEDKSYFVTAPRSATHLAMPVPFDACILVAY